MLVTADPESDPSSSDSSLIESDFRLIKMTENSKSRHAIQRKSVENTRKRNPQTHHRAILICPTTVTIAARDAERRATGKKDPIKLCTRLTARLMTAAYKSKIINFKLYEDPLQHRIYFLTFVESLGMIFSQHKETCEVLLDYPKIGGENIKHFSKNSIRNLLYGNIDVHIRILIAEFPIDGVKGIEISTHIVPT